MDKTSIILIILSVVIAGLLSFYQYIYKAKSKSSLNLFLAFLRFLSIFFILVLLVNPIITSKSYEIEKTPLSIVVDNSSSILEFSSKDEVQKLYTSISENQKIKDKYTVELFQFDAEVKPLDTLNFKGKSTHIDNVAKTLQQLNRNKAYPIVLLSDGNQTIGNDFVYSFKENTPVYPIILGDTTKVFDLKINQVNVNKYAFLKNKFPVEIFTQYNGEAPLTTTLSIQTENQTIYKQNITFNKEKKAQSVSVLLDANSVGIKKYKAVISSVIKEKNTTNNNKYFSVEVIDQRSEIAIISDITHPDLSALKRSIEVNQQRKVNIIKPNEIKLLENCNVLILYQPNSSFKSIFDWNKSAQKNYFIITGLATDFNFLNQVQTDFSFKMSQQKEDYLADFKTDFNVFAIDDIGFTAFPPLENKFGTITPLQNNSTLLNARIRNTSLQQPLLTFLEVGKQRKAYLFGENIWKWRMELYLNKKTFEDFDIFIDKTIQYLASNSSKKNLMVAAESFYNAGEPIEITAQYFNKNYEFDADSELTIQLTNSETKNTKSYAFLLSNHEFKVNFDGLEKGNYTYIITEKKSNTKASGRFEVLDFEMEKQFVNPDKDRLVQLADNTSGGVFYPNQIETLIATLANDANYIPIEKEISKKSPLIDWKWLIAFIISFLAIEWFVRKYNGLL